MEHRRTLTMNWDNAADEDDDDRFFESCERVSTVTPSDLAASSGSEDDEFEDSRKSFASCISSTSYATIHTLNNLEATQSASPIHDYGLWMSEPGDINERRKRLLQGMGLASNRNLLKAPSAKIMPVLSRKFDNAQVSLPQPESTTPPSEDSKQTTEPEQEPEPESSPETIMVRSRSDGDIESFSLSTKMRKDELIGPISKQSLTRTSSLIITPNAGLCQYGYSIRISHQKDGNKSTKPKNGVVSSIVSDGAFGSIFLIKNLDTGNEFVVKEFNDKGVWNKLSDLQTGKQLSIDEFEKSVGYSPVVKELMRREDVSISEDENRKVNAQSYLSKSFRYSKRRGVALLKNIKGVANSMSGLMIADKERENLTPLDHKAAKNSSQWVKVRHQGKSYKEFTALHLCQEFQAHEGSIWAMKFSPDARFLASAGEDRLVNVWEVQECEVMFKTPDDLNSVSGTHVPPLASNPSDKPSVLSELPPAPSERRKRGKNSNKKKNNGIPDYANVPETVFSLSDKPICTFTGHLDDVLDLSWSRDLLLLSSSMDKTVRLWDMETKSCLKLFAHNDYVTCINFNPVDDHYFISGSLDAKVRIWNIPDRQVVDWTDLHEMVTAVCYTPNGQGAIIGTHQGNCRSYSVEDCKLEQKDQIDVRSKKAQGKKVTGIQFAPWNPDEFLITTADSRIQIVEGTDVTNKFRGFRNTSSQISASFSPEGKFIITASEDNQVYIWKRDDPKSGKTKRAIITQAHEHFPCRDVSVAIPWPGSIKNEPPIVELHSKRHSRRVTSQSNIAIDSPPREDNNNNAVISNSKRQQLPPLPKKNNNATESITSSADEEFQSSRIDPGIGVSESFTSASSGSERFGDSSSIASSGSSRSQSWSPSWSLFDGGSSSHGGHTMQATAWGMVIVTATMGGEIRVYQNFGLPVKVGHLL